MKPVRVIPCKICSSPSTGFHYGALTCEACKAFFRRVIKSNSGTASLACSGDNSTNSVNISAPSSPTTQNSSDDTTVDCSGIVNCDLVNCSKKCPKCRFSRCLEVGMSPEASKIGRPNKARLKEFNNELHRVASFSKTESSDLSKSKLPHSSKNSPTETTGRKRQCPIEKPESSFECHVEDVEKGKVDERPEIFLKLTEDFSKSEEQDDATKTVFLGDAEDSSGCNSMTSNESDNNWDWLDKSGDECLYLISDSSIAELLLQSNDEADDLLDILPVSRVEPEQQSCAVSSSDVPHQQLHVNGKETCFNFACRSTEAIDLTDYVQTLKSLVKKNEKSEFIWLYGSAVKWFNLSTTSWPLSENDDPMELYLKYFERLELGNNESEDMNDVAKGVTQAVRYIFNLNSVYLDFGEESLNLTLVEFWGTWQQEFEVQCVNLIKFMRNIPGFTTIKNVQDRALLASHSIYPLILVTLSLNFDASLELARTFWMGNDTIQLVSARFPETRNYFLQFKKQFIDFGYAIKSANLTVVEFAFTCALIHFNANIDGLVQRDEIAKTSAVLRNSAEKFIRENFADKGYAVVDRRISNINILVNRLQRSNQLYFRLSAELISKVPSLLKHSGEVFREMNARVFKPSSYINRNSEIVLSFEEKSNCVLQKSDNV